MAQQQQQVGRPDSTAGTEAADKQAAAREAQLASQLQQLRAELAEAQQHLQDTGQHKHDMLKSELLVVLDAAAVVML